MLWGEPLLSMTSLGTVQHPVVHTNLEDLPDLRNMSVEDTLPHHPIIQRPNYLASGGPFLRLVHDSTAFILLQTIFLNVLKTIFLGGRRICVVRQRSLFWHGVHLLFEYLLLDTTFLESIYDDLNTAWRTKAEGGWNPPRPLVYKRAEGRWRGARSSDGAEQHAVTYLGGVHFVHNSLKRQIYSLTRSAWTLVLPTLDGPLAPLLLLVLLHFLTAQPLGTSYLPIALAYARTYSFFMGLFYVCW